jgi:hypothetical protein
LNYLVRYWTMAVWGDSMGLWLLHLGSGRSLATSLQYVADSLWNLRSEQKERLASFNRSRQNCRENSSADFQFDSHASHRAKCQSSI